MASKLVKYGFCQCWQHPGCCCCCLDLCKHTRCGGDCLVVVNHLPCCICLRLAVEEHVLIVGLKGAGKTTLLYYLMLHQLIKNAKPTKGNFLSYFFHSPIPQLSLYHLQLVPPQIPTCKAP